MVSLAAGIVLIPHAPLGLITTAVQALAGILLPSATVFLVLLCNDPAVLGPWVNKAWLNVVATLIVSVLLLLSLVLVVSTLIPSLDVTMLVIGIGSFMAGALAVAGVWVWFSQRGAIRQPEVSRAERETWRMPGLALLERPKWSTGRRVAMLTLSGYLVLAIILLVVKAVELALGH
jgi:hypothetical protein